MADRASTIYFDLAAGERIEIEGCVHVEVEPKFGRHARLRITAPRSVRVQRRDEKQDPAAEPAPNIAD